MLTRPLDMAAGDYREHIARVAVGQLADHGSHHQPESKGHLAAAVRYSEVASVPG
jgi:hypothetical protein